MRWQHFLTRWYGFFGWLWALPVTLLACIPLVILLIFKQVQFLRRYGWVLEFEVTPETWAEKTLWKWSNATAGGGVIVYHRWYKDNDNVVCHERRHAWQIFVMGIFQPIVYVIHSGYMILFRRGKNHPYIDNVFEVDSRKAAGQTAHPCRDDYAKNWPNYH